MGKSDRQEISRDAPCPCGSGKKYRCCCFFKAFDYVVNEDGEISRELPLMEELHNFVENQKRLFFERYGREMEPEDPLFFDAPPLEHLEAELVEGMRKASVDPAIIYAFEQTGFFVTELNLHMIPDSDLALWNAAIDEYRDIQELEEGQEFF